MTRARDLANIGPGVQTGNRNAIINGGFDIFQRSSTPTTGINTASSTQAYTLDRLWVYSNGPAVTTSQQVTSDTTNLPNIQYCARLQRQSGQTSTTSTVWNMPLETKDSIRFAGQSVTVSFYARKSSTFTAGLSVVLYSGTGTDQSGVGGYTGNATVVSSTPSLTTTWTRYTMTGTVAATATELRIEFSSSWAGTAGAADYFEVTGVQLEAGSAATPFERRPIGMEFDLCRRYYERYTAASHAYFPQSPCNVDVGNRAETIIQYYPKRTNPTITSSGTITVESVTSGTAQATANTVSSLVGTGLTTTNIFLSVTTWTANVPCIFLLTGAGAYIEVSAEL